MASRYIVKFSYILIEIQMKKLVVSIVIDLKRYNTNKFINFPSSLKSSCARRVHCLFPCAELVSILFLDYLISVCNFQSMKSPVELNSLLSKFFCYITWYVKSPD